MKYLKTFENTWNDYIFLDNPIKSPENYRFNIGDYVKYDGNNIYLLRVWKKGGFNENSICIICTVNPSAKSQHGARPYNIVPVEAPDSSFEFWVNEIDLIIAPEHEVAALKYNL